MNKSSVFCLAGAAMLHLAGCNLRTGVLSDPVIQQQAAAEANDSEILIMQSGKWDRPSAPQPGTPEGDRQIADSLFRSEDYQTAVKAFKELHRKYKDKPEMAEYALFMKAECHFQLNQLPDARDDYELLLKNHPGGKYNSEANKRLFTIADVWLEDARQDVKAGTPSSFPRRIVTISDDKPFFDVDGHAIKTLENVRGQEPNGPLADDSLMMSAGYFFSLGNYQQADLMLDQLIHAYPRSDFQAEAHLLSAESKLQSYKGALYDGRKLEESKRILQASLRQFPDKLENERQRIYHKLSSIEQEYARREYDTAEWYIQIGKPQSAKYYFQLVQAKYPRSKWAERAAARIQEIDAAPVTESEPSWWSFRDVAGGES